MAATSILANGTSEARSSEVTLAAGSSGKVSLRPPATSGACVGWDCKAQLQLKTSDGGWLDIPGGTLNMDRPATNFDGPGTFSVLRRASDNACGVDSHS